MTTILLFINSLKNPLIYLDYNVYILLSYVGDHVGIDFQGRNFLY